MSREFVVIAAITILGVTVWLFATRRPQLDPGVTVLTISTEAGDLTVGPSVTPSELTKLVGAATDTWNDGVETQMTFAAAWASLATTWQVDDAGKPVLLSHLEIQLQRPKN